MRHHLTGTITSVAFARGDVVVIGEWHDGPIGPMVDVMWTKPDGHRVLLAPTREIVTFVGTVYRFDEVVVAPTTVRRTSDRAWTVSAGPLQVSFEVGRGVVGLPFVRPPWFTRWVEGPIARALLGVHTFGVSPTGISEWYRARSVRRIVAAHGTDRGVDLGPLTGLGPTRVGFSEPPRFPTRVAISPVLEDPTGALDGTVHALTRGRDRLGAAADDRVGGDPS